MRWLSCWWWMVRCDVEELKREEPLSRNCSKTAYLKSKPEDQHTDVKPSDIHLLKSIFATARALQLNIKWYTLIWALEYKASLHIPEFLMFLQVTVFFGNNCNLMDFTVAVKLKMWCAGQIIWIRACVKCYEWGSIVGFLSAVPVCSQFKTLIQNLTDKLKTPQL